MHFIFLQFQQNDNVNVVQMTRTENGQISHCTGKKCQEHVARNAIKNTHYGAIKTTRFRLKLFNMSE